VAAAGELKDFVERSELERVESSVDKAEAMLKDAERSLKTARSIASADPKSALLLAWDGIAFQALAAALLLAGYRVTSQPGHHRVAVEAGRVLLGQPALLSRIGALRRLRARGMYESESVEREEAVAALDDGEALVAIVRNAVAAARA
jgi:hypothetical protein